MDSMLTVIDFAAFLIVLILFAVKENKGRERFHKRHKGG
jgi:hypothetical protein